MKGKRVRKGGRLYARGKEKEKRETKDVGQGKEGEEKEMMGIEEKERKMGFSEV